MSKKAGKPYENLTRVIFQWILGQKEFPNLVVEHDVILQGKTLPHQIDVYWKFDIGGVPHEVIVQAKDWQQRVDQSHLLAFAKVLEDLPGQPRGIFVTRTGYQRGAKKFALAHGILLYELKEVDDPPPLKIAVDGWARYRIVQMPVSGFVTKGETQIDPANAHVLGFIWDVFTPDFSEINYVISMSWLGAEYKTEDIGWLKEFDLPLRPPDQSLFFDDKGVVIGDLQTLRREIVQRMEKEGVEKKQVTHTFEPPVFIETGSPRIPRIKVTQLSTNVEIKHTQEVRRAKMPNFTHLVMHQLNSDKKWWFAATPKVISSLSKRKSKKG